MTVNPLLPLLARLCLAALFLISGVGKIMGIAGTTGYFAKLGMPMPELMTYLAILFEVGGGILIVIGWKTRWVAWAMVIFLIVTMYFGHPFWAAEGAAAKAQLTQFLKNLSILGGFLMLAAYGPGAYSADKG